MNPKLRSRPCAAALAAALIVPGAAPAALVNAQGGQTILFNVDMSGLSVSPNYSRVDFLPQVDFGLSDPTAQGRFVFFADLDGVGAVTTQSFNASGGLSNLTFFDSWFLDGQFSVQLELAQGSLIFDPAVMGSKITHIAGLSIPSTVTLSLSPVDDDGGPAVGAVPEPSTAALLLLTGLPLLAARCRRRQRGERAVQRPRAPGRPG
jgi:hypothetical protein